MNELLLVLATTAPAGPVTPAGTPGQPNPLGFLLPAMLGAMVVFMLLSSRSQKKREKNERDTMYARMAKNDRVQTVGGVIATVISVKDNEVVLKVDESTNTKMTFLKTAIQRIITDDQPADMAKK